MSERLETLVDDVAASKYDDWWDLPPENIRLIVSEIIDAAIARPRDVLAVLIEAGVLIRSGATCRACGWVGQFTSPWEPHEGCAARPTETFVPVPEPSEGEK